MMSGTRARHQSQALDRSSWPHLVLAQAEAILAVVLAVFHHEPMYRYGQCLATLLILCGNGVPKHVLKKESWMP